MGWLQQVNGWAVGLVVGLVGALLTALFTVVWRKGAPGLRAHERLWAGARSAPVSASLVAVVVLLTGALAVATSIALAAPAANEAGAPQPEAFTSPTHAPESTPTADPGIFPASGWGPERELAQQTKRPDAAMINSIIDDPTFGDERTFMLVRLAKDQYSPWMNAIPAIPGEIYEVAMLVINDARDGGQAAENVRLRVDMPATVYGVDAASEAFITASNLAVPKIWSGITWIDQTGGGVYTLHYVAGSATLHTGGLANGRKISDDLFFQGASVGCDALDGILPAGERCKSWVSFEVKVAKPPFTVVASANTDGTSAWASRILVLPGEKVRVSATYKNTGSDMQNGVTFAVHLPPNMHYVHGSGQWRRGLLPYSSSDDDPTSAEGVAVGSAGPGEEITFYFEVLAEEPSSGPSEQELKNFVEVTVEGEDIQRADLVALWK